MTSPRYVYRVEWHRFVQYEVVKETSAFFFVQEKSEWGGGLYRRRFPKSAVWLTAAGAWEAEVANRKRALKNAEREVVSAERSLTMATRALARARKAAA